MLKGVGIGLLAGLIIGWALFGGRERVIYRDPGPRTAPPPRVPEPDDAPPPEDDWTAPPDDAETPSEAPPLDVQEVVRRADDARARGDWNAFRAALAQLGAAGTRDAQRKLVELMGDPSLDMRGRMGRRFFAWLAGAEVPGVVAAARARIERETAEKPGQAAAYDGWLALVARHGGPADLGWLDDLARDGKVGRAAVDAYVQAAARPEAARRVVALFQERDRPWFPSRWRALADANAPLARRLVEENYARVPAHEMVDLARAYGAAVNAESLPAARGFLLGLGTESERIGAVYTVQALERKGLDVSGLAAIAAAPIDAFERLAANPNRNLREFYRLVSIIRANPITWSERTVAALEAAAASADAKTALALKTTAARVEAGLARSDWK